MAWIEGFGDEVTVFLVIASFAIIVVSAILFKDLSDFQATSNDTSEQLISQSTNENLTPDENVTSATNRENSNHQENSENANSTLAQNTRETDSFCRSDVTQNHIVNGSSQRCEIYSTDDSTVPLQHEGAENSDLRTSHLSNNKLPDQKQSNEKDIRLQKKHINSEQSSTMLTNNISLGTSGENAEAPDALLRSAIEGEHRQIGDIAIRIKYMNDTEKTVYGKLSEKIGDFKSKNFSEELSENKMVRLIFNGQLLRTESTLGSCGVSEGSVIHANILQQDARSPPASVNTHTDLDLSHLFWPLLSIILGLLWVLHFKYQEIFNVTSTGILLAFTGVFFIFAFGHVRQQTGQ